MFLARMVFFRLHESPRFLVHAGRHQEALESLQMISRFNGGQLSIAIEDVNDHHPTNPADPDSTPFLAHKDDSETVFDADAIARPTLLAQSSTHFLNGQADAVAHYHATGESASPLAQGSPPTGQTQLSPGASNESPPKSVSNSSPVAAESITESVTRPRPPRPSLNANRRKSSVYETKVCSALPRWLRKPLWAWWDRVMLVLSPNWLRITLLMWGAWCSMSLGEPWPLVFMFLTIRTNCSVYHVQRFPSEAIRNGSRNRWGSRSEDAGGESVGCGYFHYWRLSWSHC